MKRSNPTSSRKTDMRAELPQPLPKLDGVLTGTLAGLSESGVPLVQFVGNLAGSPIEARSTIRVGRDEVGTSVVLVLEGGDPSRPIILGVIQTGELGAVDAARSPTHTNFKLDVDGERLEIQAKREIVLRVGKSSITLTEAGKILIRGEYLLSRSSGVNRIKGGSVQIN